jgi:hypothetical protein
MLTRGLSVLSGDSVRSSVGVDFSYIYEYRNKLWPDFNRSTLGLSPQTILARVQQAKCRFNSIIRQF